MIAKEEILKARSTDIRAFLMSENERYIQEGKSPPYELQKEGDQYRVRGYSGLIIKGKMWNQRGSEMGGNALDLLTKLFGYKFQEAVKALNGNEGRELPRIEHVPAVQKPKLPFKLPEENENFRRAIAYLTKTRCIDSDILLPEFKTGRIYEDKEHHNAVFVGVNKDEKPVWAQKRSTLTDRKFVGEVEGSAPEYTYYFGNPNARTLVVVESPIESLSFVNLMKIRGNDLGSIKEKLCVLSLGGVHGRALDQFLKEHPNVKGIWLALNNDRADRPGQIKGYEATQKLSEKYAGRYGIKIAVPKGNDWNDDLRAIRIQVNEKKVQTNPEQEVEKQIKEYAKMKRQKKLMEKGPMHAKAR